MKMLKGQCSVIQSILSNFALILLSHAAVSALVNYREHISKRLLQGAVVIVLSAAIILMFFWPIQFEGYRFDLRVLPLMMLALFANWRYTAAVLAAASIGRFILGGDGAVPGVVYGMLLPVLFTLFYAHIVKRRKRLPDIILVVTVCWVLSDLPMLFIIYGGGTVLKQLGIWHYFALLSVAVIYYLLIQVEMSRTEMKERLQFLATHDQLTKLLNRQECIRIAVQKIEKYKNQQHFIVMIDIDYFKELNDVHGHLAGDDVLKQLSSILRDAQHDRLVVSRYGGEEFMLYVNAQTKAEAAGQIDEIQKAIRRTKFWINGVQNGSITVSIGMAQWQPEESIQHAIKAADDNLYTAKEQGRNQLVF